MSKTKKTKRDEPVDDTFQAIPDEVDDIINIDDGTVEPPASKSLVDQIKEQRRLAAMDLQEVPINTRNAFSIAKANAVDVVKALEAEYAAFVNSASVFLILEGEPAKVRAFAEIARVMGPTVVLDGEGVFQELANAIDHTMPQSPKTFDTIQYLGLISAITELGSELNIASIPRPIFQSTSFGDASEIAPFLRHLVETSSSSELNVMVLKRELLKQALDIGFSSAVPVVLINPGDDGELKANLLQDPTRAMTFVVRDEVTEEAVEAVLSQLVRLVSA